MMKIVINGNIIYELINDNGQVKEYYKECDLNGKLKYEGEYLDEKVKKNIGSCINLLITLIL